MDTAYNSSSFLFADIINKNNNSNNVYFTNLDNNEFHMKMLPKYRNFNAIKKNAKNRYNYIIRLNNNNPFIILIGDYTDITKKTLHFCLIHSVLWDGIPRTIVNGVGCPQCTYEKKSNRGKSHEQYVEELKEKNPYVKVIGKYINANTKITHFCLIHNIEYEAQPSNALKGCGCPICHFERSGKGRRKTTKQYMNELKELNSSIIPLEEYITVKDKILHRNLNCKHEFYATPDTVLRNPNMCSICYNQVIGDKLRLSNNEYLLRLNNANPGVVPLEDYQGANIKILHRFPCGHVNKVAPGHLLDGHGCKICSDINKGLRLRMSQKEFEEKVKNNNPYIKIIGEYKTTNDEIQCECLLCGFVWEALANNVYIGHGCPKCNMPYGEKKISMYLERNNIPYISQKKFEDLKGIGNKSLSYDFYLPTYNKLIEVQGEQHARPIDFFGGEETFKKQQEHDKRKKEYAITHGYDFIEIWYYDFDVIDNILDINLKSKCVETVIPA